jgi:hypothetical protein
MPNREIHRWRPFRREDPATALEVFNKLSLTDFGRCDEVGLVWVLLSLSEFLTKPSGGDAGSTRPIAAPQAGEIRRDLFSTGEAALCR